MPLDLDPIPIVDNHCHSLLRRQPADDAAFRVHLTETYYPEVAARDVPYTLLYRWAIKELAITRGTTAGKVISELARKALTPTRSSRVRNGVPLLARRPAGARRPTMKQVNALRDEA